MDLEVQSLPICFLYKSSLMFSKYLGHPLLHSTDSSILLVEAYMSKRSKGKTE